MNDRWSVTLLFSLNLSAALDCIDHKILLDKLESNFGVTGSASSWIRSFLSDRTRRVVVKGSKSKLMPFIWGVLQCSGLGPALFSLYTARSNASFNAMVHYIARMQTMSTFTHR